jgi:hypothetical protein
MKIRRVTRPTNPDSVDITLEGRARINITMARIAAGVNIYEILNSWSEKEKEAALILWSMSQRNQAIEMQRQAEQLIEQAKSMI